MTRQFEEEHGRRITAKTKGGVFQIRKYEIVVTHLGPRDSQLTLLIQQLRHLGSDGEATFGHPQSIEEKEGIEKFLNELKDYRQKQSTNSALAPYPDDYSRETSEENIASSDCYNDGKRSQIEFATQAPIQRSGFTGAHHFQNGTKSLELRSSSHEPIESISQPVSLSAQREVQIEDVQNPAVHGKAINTITRPEDLLALLHKTAVKCFPVAKDSSLNIVRRQDLPNSNVGESSGRPEDPVNVDKVRLHDVNSIASIHSVVNVTGRHDKVDMQTKTHASGIGLKPSSQPLSETYNITATLDNDLLPQQQEGRLATVETPREKHDRKVLPDPSASEVQKGDIRPGGQRRKEMISRREVIISKGQQELLDHDDSWLPAAPGHRAPAANLPINVLQSLNAIAEQGATAKENYISCGNAINSESEDPSSRSNEGEDGSSDADLESSHQVTEWDPSQSPLRAAQLPPDSSMDGPPRQQKHSEELTSHSIDLLPRPHRNASQYSNLQHPSSPSLRDHHTTSVEPATRSPSHSFIRDTSKVGQMSEDPKLGDRAFELRDVSSAYVNGTSNEVEMLDAEHDHSGREQFSDSDLETTMPNALNSHHDHRDPPLPSTALQPTGETLQVERTPLIAKEVADGNEISEIYASGRTVPRDARQGLEFSEYISKASSALLTARTPSVMPGSSGPQKANEVPMGNARNSIVGSRARNPKDVIMPRTGFDEGESDFDHPIRKDDTRRDNKRAAPESTSLSPNVTKRRYKRRICEELDLGKTQIPEHDPSILVKQQRRDFYASLRSKREQESKRNETRKESQQGSRSVPCGSPALLITMIPPEPLNIFQLFRSTYPEYSGDLNHFTAIGIKIGRLLKEGRMEHKSLWDDYIVRHWVDYRRYTARCADSAEDPKPYEQYYRDDVEDPCYTKRVVTPASLDQIQSLRDLYFGNRMVASSAPDGRSGSGKDLALAGLPEQSNQSNPKRLFPGRPMSEFVDLTQGDNVGISTHVASSPLKELPKNVSSRSLPWNTVQQEFSTPSPPRPSLSASVENDPAYATSSRASRSTKTRPAAYRSSPTHAPGPAAIPAVTTSEQVPIQKRSSETTPKSTLAQSISAAQSRKPQSPTSSLVSAWLANNSTPTHPTHHFQPRVNNEPKQPTKIQNPSEESKSTIKHIKKTDDQGSQNAYPPHSAKVAAYSIEPKAWFHDPDAPFKSFRRAWNSIIPGNGNSFVEEPETYGLKKEKGKQRATKSDLGEGPSWTAGLEVDRNGVVLAERKQIDVLNWQL